MYPAMLGLLVRCADTTAAPVTAVPNRNPGRGEAGVSITDNPGIWGNGSSCGIKQHGIGPVPDSSPETDADLAPPAFVDEYSPDHDDSRLSPWPLPF
jgi:hypothetical protein